MVMPETKPESPEFFKTLNSLAKRQHSTFWLSTRFMTPTARRLALCILCLDGEFYRVVSGVNEEIVAQIRLQWWRDEIARLSDGEQGQLTDAGRALSYLLANRSACTDGLMTLVNAYDDMASGQASDYPQALFGLLFFVMNEHRALAEEYGRLAGDVFQSANTARPDREAVRRLSGALEKAPDGFWPVLCLFEFLPDWAIRRKPGATEARWRILKAFLGGEKRLQSHLNRFSDQNLEGRG